MTEPFTFSPAMLAAGILCVGKTGSGKSSTAKLAIEQVVAEGARVCILDPIKSDWWGLTSSADGKEPGLPFQILGGKHGHVPLHSSAGRAIGSLVASGELPLSIIDMKFFELGGAQRFFVDFAHALFEQMRGVVYLVLEEAHEFAPKERAGFGSENFSLHWAKKLATAGRTQGIRLIAATQRTQQLHNAIMGSCETTIIHRITLPADQAPVLDLFKKMKDRTIYNTIADELASLPNGTAFVFSGEAQIFEKRAFPRIKTYDNTATPTGEGADRQIRTAVVDVAKLRTAIGEAVKEAEANDPTKLKAQIAELEKKLAAARSDRAESETGPDIAAIEDAARIAGFSAGEQEGFRRGKIEGYSAGVADGWAESRRRMAEVIDAELSSVPDNITAHQQKALEAKAPEALVSVANTPASRRAETPLRPSSSGAVKPTLQRCLDAIAWWKKIGIQPVERNRAAVVAGYSPKASTFGVYIAELVTLGYVETSPGMVRLTAEGLKLAHVPKAASRAELRELARGLPKPQEARVFDCIYAAYPKAIRREAVAEKVGLSPTASTAGVYIAGVMSYRMIEAAGRGEVRAADWLFP